MHFAAVQKTWIHNPSTPILLQKRLTGYKSRLNRYTSMYLLRDQSQSDSFSAPQMILFLASSNFFRISPGVLSNSSAIFLCKSRGRVGNCSQRSPSITSYGQTQCIIIRIISPIHSIKSCFANHTYYKTLFFGQN